MHINLTMDFTGTRILR